MSGRSFLLLSLLLVGHSQGFDVSGPSDDTEMIENFNYADHKGFIVSMSICVGCLVATILYFVVLCIRHALKKSTPEDETVNIEMCLNRDGSVAPRLASAVAVSLATRANSVHAKPSVASNKAVRVSV